MRDVVLKMKIRCCCKFRWVGNFRGWNSCLSDYTVFVLLCVVYTPAHQGLLGRVVVRASPSLCCYSLAPNINVCIILYSQKQRLETTLRQACRFYIAHTKKELKKAEFAGFCMRHTCHIQTHVRTLGLLDQKLVYSIQQKFK